MKEANYDQHLQVNQKIITTTSIKKQIIIQSKKKIKMHHSRLYTAILAICLILITTTTSKTAGQILDSIKNIKALNGSDDLFVLCTANKDDKACIKTIVGMQDCFILNECYNQKLSEQMNVHCWNCWVDYVTDSHTVSDFQDQIRKRNWAHQAGTFGMLLIAMIFALFAL